MKDLLDEILTHELTSLSSIMDKLLPTASPSEMRKIISEEPLDYDQTSEVVPPFLRRNGDITREEWDEDVLEVDEDGINSNDEWILVESTSLLDNGYQYHDEYINNQAGLEQYLQRKRNVITSELSLESGCKMVITLINDAVVDIKRCNSHGLSDYHWSWKFEANDSIVYKMESKPFGGTLSGSFMLRNEIGLWVPKVMIEVSIDVCAQVTQVEVTPSQSMISGTTAKVVLEAFPRTYHFPEVSPSWYEFLLLREKLPLSNEASAIGSTLFEYGSKILYDTASMVWEGTSSK